MSQNTLSLRLRGRPAASTAMPAALAQATRSAGSTGDEFINEKVVTTRAVYDLSAPSRAASSEPLSTGPLDDDAVLALEASDGSTLFISAERLRDAAFRKSVLDATGVNLDALSHADPATRGLGDWLWSKVSVLEIKPDALVAAAKKKAVDLAKEWLGDLLPVNPLDGVSWVGARALMAVIESRLLREPGLYRWVGAEHRAEDLESISEAQLASEATKGQLLVFLHGTASNTSGSFGDAYPQGRDWEALRKIFGERVYGFEHRSLSESPVENALQLARVLPAGARVNLVSHSRGGLVGDLLCLGALRELDFSNWNRRAAPGVDADEIEKITARERTLLRELDALLREKKFVIERYVRVASPARGTLLAAGSFDVFLSALLSVIGTVSGLKASGFYSAFARVVLEIVKRRMDPQVVPGIEAMLPQAPLPLLLATAPRIAGLRMAVIAGDVKGGSLWQRLGVLFTDWTFFGRTDNDLVVNTDSMFEGIARADEGAHFLFDRGAKVTHFHYFRNPRTQRALRAWLLSEGLGAVDDFAPLGARGALAQRDAAVSRAAQTRAPNGQRPIVVVLPGIMGSHLALRAANSKAGDKDRVWFDPWSIARGGLADLRYDRRASGQTVEPDGLFDRFYGELCEHLQATHDVVRFAYDWRAPIEQEATRLGARVEELLKLVKTSGKPLRLLAHSMGGLVCRAMIRLRPELWRQISAHADSRFVMLGTPNHGSHLMVQQLLGLADSTRQLAAIDLRHDLQEVLDIVATMPGALQLLPRPGFRDTAGEQEDSYFASSVWTALRPRVRDRWFGDAAVAVPRDEVLKQTAERWKNLLGEDQAPDRPERICYVFGMAPETPCGLRKFSDAKGRAAVQMLSTAQGDGSVTWESGRLPWLRDRSWYLRAAHGDLACTRSAFDAIGELLAQGRTAKLETMPPVSRDTGPQGVRVYEPGPPVAPNEEELAAGLFGTPHSAGAPRPSRIQRTLRLSVSATDLRFATSPLLCGHYPGDPISGAEASLDEEVVDGALRERERLGLYPGALGTSALVLMPQSQAQRVLGVRRGALILGLGEFGSLNARGVTETVRAAVLRYLLAAHEALMEVEPFDGAQASREPLALCSVLIGHNSTTSISIEDAMAAICQGVMEANHQFEENLAGGASAQERRYVESLEFIELYLDTAISAARAASALPQRLGRELSRLGVALDVAAEPRLAEGVQERLHDASTGGSYWPRIVVTGSSPNAAELPAAAADESTHASAHAARLHFLFLSQRARAEAVMQQRQPRLLEALVHDAVGSTHWNRELSNTLFQLLVPVDFKDSVRNSTRLVLVVDGHTANLPWEMMASDGEPLVLRMQMVRQLASMRFRVQVRNAVQNAAYVVGEPSTEGFRTHFPQFGGGDGDTALVALPGAAQEAAQVREVLDEADYRVDFADAGSRAADVIGGLYRRPYRIVHIAAHGVFNVMGKDGEPRSGVVLSDGLLLTAAEIGQMEMVPELVFLNCCHLGKADSLPRESRRMAYSLARELIEMGVRCVIAAGWEVQDAAGALFASTLYRSLLAEGANFGEAVFAARRATFQVYPDSNTWGAYQAYGDPAFTFYRRGGDGLGSGTAPVCARELIAAIERCCTRLAGNPGHRALASGSTRAPHRAGLAESVQKMAEAAPADWLARADVSYALARFWDDYGDFTRAHVAYLAALGGAEGSAGVSITLIEKLANLEAREGEKRGNQTLIRRGIARLEALRALDADSPERAALLGSAYKRMASVIAASATAAQRERARAWLRKSHAAYAAHPDAPFDAYRAVNVAQLAALLDDKAGDNEALALADKATQTARARFERSRSFFDAVTPVDAELARLLLAGGLDDAAAKKLAKDYREASLAVPAENRRFDSVVRHLLILARLWSALKRNPDTAKALQRTAAALDPAAAAEASLTP